MSNTAPHHLCFWFRLGTPPFAARHPSTFRCRRESIVSRREFCEATYRTRVHCCRRCRVSFGQEISVLLRNVDFLAMPPRHVSRIVGTTVFVLQNFLCGDIFPAFLWDNFSPEFHHKAGVWFKGFPKFSRSRHTFVDSRYRYAGCNDCRPSSCDGQSLCPARRGRHLRVTLFSRW